MGRALTGVLLDEAERAVALASTDPARARRLATSVVERAGDDAPEAVAVAEWALGFVARELLHVDEALQHMQRAIEIAEGANLPMHAARVRVSLALELVNLGHTRRALTELDRATTHVGHDDVRLLNQMAVVYMRLGHYDSALDAARRAVTSATRRGDDDLLELALGNRGIARAWLGDSAGAEADLVRAEAMRAQQGDDMSALFHHHNRGFAKLRAGDLPAALRFYDEAEAGLARLGVLLAGGRIDRAEALLRAGLAREALDVASAAADEFAAGGRAAEHAEAMVYVARAAADAGDIERALRAARAARLALEAQERPAWAAFARCLEARTALAAAGSDADAVNVAVLSALAAADVAAEVGWFEQSLELRLRAGETAWRAGFAELCRRAVLLPASMRRRRSPTVRMLGWHAQALCLLVAGDVAGARQALVQSLQALAAHRAMLGSLDLRVSSARAGESAAQLLVDLTVPTGSPADVMTAAEQLRAAALHAPSAIPPHDAALRNDLDQLRAAVLDEEAAVLRPDGADDVRRRRTDLEQAVMSRARHAAGGGARREIPKLVQLQQQLGSRILVSYLVSRDRLLAVVVTAAAARLVRLGGVEEIRSELRQLRFALRRVTTGDDRAVPLVVVGAARLDALLLAPLDLPSDSAVVIAPTRELHAVPWSALPAFAERPVEVTPSVSMWARPMAPAGFGVAAIAGPELPGALAEVAAVAECHAGVRVLVGEAATVEASLRAIDGAAIAHLACHGSFRADNASFSSLLLHDGPLLGYDLDRVHVPPRLVVLSACDSGRSGIHAGDELLGLSAALLGRGSSNVIASIVPVDDEATREVMTVVHRAVASGATPSAALLAARAAPTDPVTRAVATAFVCFTAGLGQNGQSG